MLCDLHEHVRGCAVKFEILTKVALSYNYDNMKCGSSIYWLFFIDA